MASSEQRVVVQTGTYSSWNKGDAAMELTMAELLAADGTTVWISCPFPDHDRSLYGEATIRSPRRNLPLSAVLVVMNWLWRVTGRRLAFLLGDEQGARMAEATLVVDLSGDMLTEDSGPHVAISHFVPLLRAKALGRPYAVVAQSIGPFRMTKGLARWLLSGAALVTVRETQTAEYLTRVLPAVDFEETGDLAFLMRPDEQVPIDLPSSPFVAVSISSLVDSMLDRSSGLSLVDELAAALDRLHAEAGVGAVAVSHVTGPTADKDDRILARRLAGQMQSDLLVVEDDLSPTAIKAVIGRSELIIGARMHANIAALSQGIPAVALAYSHKTLGIMDDLGLPSLVVDCRERVEPGTIGDVLTAAWTSRSVHRSTLERSLPAMQARSRRNLELLGDLVQDR